MEPVGTMNISQKNFNMKDYLDFTYLDMPLDERRKINVGDIYDNKIQCKECGWIIRSKNRHNKAYCKCGLVSVDGGSWYQIIDNPEHAINHIVMFNKLYRDNKDNQNVNE